MDPHVSCGTTGVSYDLPSSPMVFLVRVAAGSTEDLNSQTSEALK